jgi:hypothetical protein
MMHWRQGLPPPSGHSYRSSPPGREAGTSVWPLGYHPPGGGGPAWVLAPWCLVEGEVLPTRGEAGEPLLAPGTVRVLACAWARDKWSPVNSRAFVAACAMEDRKTNGGR